MIETSNTLLGHYPRMGGEFLPNAWGELFASRAGSSTRMEQILKFFRRRPGVRTGTLLSGSLVWLVGFFLLPLAYLLAVSFAQRSPYGTIPWSLGLSNHARAFQPLYLETYGRSFGCSLCCLPACTAPGGSLGRCSNAPRGEEGFRAGAHVIANLSLPLCADCDPGGFFPQLLPTICPLAGLHGRVVQAAVA